MQFKQHTDFLSAEKAAAVNIHQSLQVVQRDGHVNVKIVRYCIIKLTDEEVRKVMSIPMDSKITS